jgi:esterase
MGGKTAMLFAKKHPEIAEKLIIVDISPFSYKNLTNRNELSISHINIINTLYNIKLNRAKSIFEIKNQMRETIKENRLINFLSKNIKHDSGKTYSWKFNLETIRNELPNILDGFEKNTSIEKQIKINIPCLFIKGENSYYISVEDKKDIINIFPKSRIITIPNSGHWVHAEQKEKFINIIKKWLLSVSI